MNQLLECLCMDSDIIRPVAFRPFVGKKPETTRQSITSNSSYFYAKHGAEQPNECQSGVDQFKRTSHFAEVSSVTSPSSRPHPIYQPSTSAGPSSLPGQQYLSKLSKSGKEENDYDVVPEYIDRDKLSADDSGSSDNYSILYQAPLQGGRAHLQQRSAPSRPNKSTFTTFPVGNVNLPTTIAKKSPSSHHVCGSNTSSGSRNSSGVHITPSPSDSGIVDYESIIRDKESELTTVRNTMEQNEEVIIRVYQEKERVWKEHLADLKQKLQASQQGENALRQQIQRCNEQRDQFQATIQNLSSDKQGLQRKCLQIEREMFEIRERFGELLRARDSACESCKRQSSNVDGDRRARPPPLPMPRQKETSGMDRDLRVEVEQLRSEISTLRDMLNEQIGLFSDERKRWEIERNKMISSNNIRATGTTEARVAVDSRAPLSGTQCIVSGDRLI
ncbi:hypothetical protein Tcan_18551 [Toxocara canis]|uniref:Uncharacterized protein n=1 Tax=Toxocara canis TaxID=6265 RepID=A0A0B2VQI5_TOXCA|nr:hypothetical protein Tcan_18551 [Toxocara canis]